MNFTEVGSCDEGPYQGAASVTIKPEEERLAAMMQPTTIKRAPIRVAAVTLS